MLNIELRNDTLKMFDRVWEEPPMVMEKGPEGELTLEKSSYTISRALVGDILEVQQQETVI